MNKKDLKIVEITFTDLENYGIQKISLVDKPAIGENFVFYGEEHYAKFDKDNKTITGPILIPDKLILREKDGEFYYHKWSKEVIKKFNEKYFLDKKQLEINLQHELDIKNIYVYESWLINDPKNDKANSLGFDLPEGTWMVSMKVDDDYIWDKVITNEYVKGFSIEFNTPGSYNKITDEIIMEKIIDILKSIDN